jgi:ribose transport system ATP-binding protein
MGIVNWRALRAASRRQLAKIGVDIDVMARASELTFAARQMVELAKALTLEESVARSLVILLDEPTSVLSAADIDVLFARVRSLKSRASFVFVSHRLDEVLRISDRVYTMKDGQVVAEHRAADVAAPVLHKIMVGRGVQTEYYKEQRQREPGSDVVLETTNLGVGKAFRHVDFNVHVGEIVGIAGVVGSGREELTRTIGGFLPHDEGTLVLNGKPVRFTSPRHAVHNRVGYVPRERRIEGLVLYLSIAENITLADLSCVMQRGVINHKREKQMAADWIKKLHIKAPGPDVACRKLSGGNQQKVVLARWMTAGSRILILDHPTRGLDVGAKEEVYDLVRDLSAQGIAILLISDTLEETIGLSHKVLVMRDGKITARFDAGPGNKPDQIELLRAMV